MSKELMEVAAAIGHIILLKEQGNKSESLEGILEKLEKRYERLSRN